MNFQQFNQKVCIYEGQFAHIIQVSIHFMTNDIKKKKIRDKSRYDERHRFWTEQALNQFGTASNFFFVISLGFLAFIFEKIQIRGLLNFDSNLIFDFRKFWFVLSIILALFSLMAGALTVLSRLHDLRLTRHILTIRKRSNDLKSIRFNDSHKDLKKYTFKTLIVNFLSTLTKDEYFISDKDIKDPQVIYYKFEQLRLRTLLLSRLSWLTFNSQIIYLIFSLILYSISVML